MNKLFKLFSLSILCALAFAQALASEPETAPITALTHQQANAFIRSKVGLSDDLRVSVDGFDATVDSRACQDPEFFIPGQLPVLRGFVRIGLRCTKPLSWVRYGSANITQAQTAYTLKIDLPLGHVITADDLTTVISFQKLPTAGFGPDSLPFVGRTLVKAMTAGTPLQRSHTQASWVIKGGQILTIYSGGPAFRISSEGRALGNAEAGQPVQVRTAGGKILSGQALAEGSVELFR